MAEVLMNLIMPKKPIEDFKNYINIMNNNVARLSNFINVPYERVYLNKTEKIPFLNNRNGNHVMMDDTFLEIIRRRFEMLGL